VDVVGPPTQIVHHEIDDARVNRPARQRLAQWIQVVREDRDDIYSHR